MKTRYHRANFLAPLTYKALGSNQLQSYFISQDGGVAVGDVGKRAGMDKHGGSLRIQTSHVRHKTNNSRQCHPSGKHR